MLVKSGADCSLTDGQDVSIIKAMEAAFGAQFVEETVGNGSSSQLFNKGTQIQQISDIKLPVFNSKNSLNSTISGTPKETTSVAGAKELLGGDDRLLDDTPSSDCRAPDNSELSVNCLIEETAKVR